MSSSEEDALFRGDEVTFIFSFQFLWKVRFVMKIVLRLTSIFFLF